MNDADLISIIRQLRRLVGTLDSIGFPAKQLYTDEELSMLIPAGLPSKIVDVAADTHTMLNNIEKSRRYREAVKQFCVKEKK